MYEKSTLTPLLDKLEDAGLLLRARDPKDGRVQRLFITKKGRKRRRDADLAVTAVMTTMLSTLPKKVLKHHVEFCETVLAALTADQEAPARSH
jgi:DNA-binding MarR family transcriptional regulator